MAEFYLEIFMFRPYNVLTLCLWVYKATTQTLAELSGLVCGPFFVHTTKVNNVLKSVEVTPVLS